MEILASESNYSKIFCFFFIGWSVRARVCLCVCVCVCLCACVRAYGFVCSCEGKETSRKKA